jgi:myo-inositol-1(or 4)-monophosphatase
VAASLGRGLTVAYKTDGKGTKAPTDPVSEIDRAVEEEIRAGLGRDFPGHAVIGEEIDEQPDAGAEFTWVIDPVDGTSNFVNGFPLFACSVGVLQGGEPVAGAIWVSTSPSLRAGVYHASNSGPLRFEGEPVIVLEPHEGLRRRLSAAPGGSPGRATGWDNRVTGSSAIECAFVAAGVFVGAHFRTPGIWDVAGGVPLLRAAGREVRTLGPGGWEPLERFVAPARTRSGRPPSLRDWKQQVAIGIPEAVEAVVAREKRRPRILRSARQLLLRI